jgi:hypothetical protein
MVLLDNARFGCENLLNTTTVNFCQHNPDKKSLPRKKN